MLSKISRTTLAAAVFLISCASIEEQPLATAITPMPGLACTFAGKARLKQACA